MGVGWGGRRGRVRVAGVVSSFLPCGSLKLGWAGGVLALGSFVMQGDDGRFVFVGTSMADGDAIMLCFDDQIRNNKAVLKGTTPPDQALPPSPKEEAREVIVVVSHTYV